jgi:signal transduction histidine kinase
MSPSNGPRGGGSGGARSRLRWVARLFRTLRGRLLLLAGFAVVPALLFAFFAAARERHAAVERLEAEARHLGTLAAREHAHQLNGARSLLERLAAAVPCTGGAHAAACPAWLPALLAGFPQLANIGVAIPEGRVICSAAPIPLPAQLAENVAFTRALASTGVETGAYSIGLVGRPVLHLARAIRDPGGSACAVVFVAVELGWLEELARHTHLPEDYSLLIADRTGRVLARSDAGAGARAEPAGALAEALEHAGGTVVEVGNPQAPRFVVASPMEEVPGVHVVAGMPYARVRSAANRAFYRTLVGLLLVTLLGIGAAVVAAEVSIFRVLRALIATVRRLAGGDLSARAPLPTSHGELRELAMSFGAMAEALAAREREALDAQARLRALSHRLQAARDEEAGRIARELHDELGQILTGLKLELASLRRADPAAGRPAAAEEALRRMGEQLDSAIDSVRRISSELRPPVLDRLGLAPAIDWLARDLAARSGLRVRFHASGAEEPVDALVSTTLFRVAQEALTNVVRHAGASEVTIDLVGSPDALALIIRDDGKGLDPGAAEGPGALGILGMRERVALVKGTWRMRGRPGEGMTVEVEVPRTPGRVESARESSP